MFLHLLLFIGIRSIVNGNVSINITHISHPTYPPTVIVDEGSKKVSKVSKITLFWKVSRISFPLGTFPTLCFFDTSDTILIPMFWTWDYSFIRNVPSFIIIHWNLSYNHWQRLDKHHTHIASHRPANQQYSCDIKKSSKSSKITLFWKLSRISFPLGTFPTLCFFDVFDDVYLFVFFWWFFYVFFWWFSLPCLLSPN